MMDVSKIDKSMPFTFAKLKDIDVLVTDKTLSESIAKAAEKYSVQLC
jgi:DeoR/GlpR family transcriptional regulator of sugar metabolism